MAKNILIVDDSAFLRKLIRKILEEAGYDAAAEAENGRDAVEKFNANRPDMVILDVIMPEMDGIEALKEMRTLDPTVPIVMCSSMAYESIVMEAVRAGAADYILKPFKPARLMATVKACIG